MGFDCGRCGQPCEPVLAHYTGRATLGGMEGAADFMLPMHSCPEGHVEGWRGGDDFLFDLVDAPATYDDELVVDTVPPQGRFLGRTRCGGCGRVLKLREDGRVRGSVRLAIPDVEEPAHFALDLPRAVCRRCGARPSSTKRLASTAVDHHGWLFQIIADAMPPERATRLEPR